MQSGCSHKVGLMWNKWLSLFFRDERGQEREGRRGERAQQNTREEKKEENREKVAPREVEENSAPDKTQPFCDTEWDERGFWQNNFFSLRFLLLFTPLTFTPFLCTSILSDLFPPSLHFAFDPLLAVFFCINVGEWRKIPHVVLLFIIKSAGVHKKTMEEKLTFYLTLQEPVNKQTKKNYMLGII